MKSYFQSKIMPTCLIYGHDGFDVDVLYNVRSIYCRMGFDVYFGSKLRPANLLVIIRPPDSNLALADYDSVHIFDYVGFSFPKLLISAKQAKDTWIFCASEIRKQQIQASIPELAERIVFRLPPVDTSLWMEKIVEPAEYDVVHIGNFKPFYAAGQDEYALLLTNMVAHDSIDVWGAGWEGVGPDANRHGPSRIDEVSKIYARAQAAIGMMYPHQRNQTLSGRFWHAPLNGCVVISEPTLYVGQIPGVSAWANMAGEASRTNPEWRRKLQSDSQRFWDAQFESFQEYLRTVMLWELYCDHPRQEIVSMSSKLDRFARLLKHRF